jgi:hypothetical protein
VHAVVDALLDEVALGGERRLEAPRGRLEEEEAEVEPPLKDPRKETATSSAGVFKHPEVIN